MQRRVASEPSRQHGLDVPTERINYVVPIPGCGGWLLLSFSTAGTARRTPSEPAAQDAVEQASTLTDVLVELFDAVVTTVRWRYS